MQGFDLGQLKTYAAVVEAGSFTAAAMQVFLSQSAVSEQMRKLEERVGQSLLTRSKLGVTPTAAGARLLAHTHRILALSDEAFRDLRGETLQGELRLAVTDYFRPGDLTRLLMRLGEGYPQMRLHVSVMKSGAIEAGYAKGDFDVGLSMRIVSKKTIGTALRMPTLRREPLSWVGVAGKRISRGEVIRLLVLPDTCSLHRFTIKALADHSVSYAVAHVASGVAGLQSALAAGLGVACLNESSFSNGITRLAGSHGLPALPQVAFHFLPARSGESDFVARVRALLTAHFA